MVNILLNRERIKQKKHEQNPTMLTRADKPKQNRTTEDHRQKTKKRFSIQERNLSPIFHFKNQILMYYNLQIQFHIGIFGNLA